MCLSEDSLTDMQWWLDNAATSHRRLYHGLPAIVLTTDASNEGYGGLRSEQGSTVFTGGRWSDEERDSHINGLEILAM